MSVDIKVPSVGESITEVQISQWLKKPGDHVEMDEDLVEVESEKASVQLPAPASGTLDEILVGNGKMAEVGQIVGRIREDGEAPSEKKAEKKADKKETENKEPAKKEAAKKEEKKAPKKSAKKAPAKKPAKQEEPEEEPATLRIMPAAKRLLAQYDLDPADIEATGPGGRLLKEDVLHYLDSLNSEAVEEEEEEVEAETDEFAEEFVDEEDSADEYEEEESEEAEEPEEDIEEEGNDYEEIVPMSFIRKRIAARLVQAQQQAALLTTFNEIDMTEVMELRSKYKDSFAQRHGVKLGFMSFFVKAAVEALQQFPAINAEIRGENIVYRKHYDIGIAVGGGKGLVVPVLREAEDLSFAEIEQKIADFGKRAQSNSLTPDELTGGTFTISNGGIYGSLLSTPIVNPPQSGILGLHAIQDRPVAINKQVVVRPMMYVALTYDHRLVDGREAVTFLRTIKDVLEDPARLFLHV